VSDAPLFVRTFDLTAWLLGHPGDTDVTRAPALALLDAVVLGLKGFDRERNLEDADAAAAVLRVRVRLAHQLGTLDERQLLYAAGELDDIGRQLGGLQRSLARGASAPRGEGGRHR